MIGDFKFFGIFCKKFKWWRYSLVMGFLFGLKVI